MKKIPIFITQLRELFKILEEQFIYIEIDRDTNSIIYASGINNEIIYMMFEDVFNSQGLQEYKKGLDYVLINPIHIYKSYINKSIFLLSTLIINEFWVIGLQPSKIVQVICNKSDKWEGLNPEFFSFMNLPMVLFKNNEIILCNEAFMLSLHYFDDINLSLLHLIEESTSLNIIQDKEGKLIPVIMKCTQNNNYIFILLSEVKLVCSTVPISVVTNKLNFDFKKEEFSLLVRMEVQLKQLEIRIKQLEKFTYLETNGIASRLKEIEVYQDQDNKKWILLDIYKKSIEDKIVSLILLNTVIKNFPGGIKGFCIMITLLVLLFLTSIDITLRQQGFKDTLDHIDKSIDKLE